jgi:hypothetical protein
MEGVRAVLSSLGRELAGLRSVLKELNESMPFLGSFHS